MFKAIFVLILTLGSTAFADDLNGSWSGTGTLKYQNGLPDASCKIDLKIKNTTEFAIRGNVVCDNNTGSRWDGWYSYYIENGELFNLARFGHKKIGTVSANSAEFELVYDEGTDQDYTTHEHFKVDLASGKIQGSVSIRTVGWWDKSKNIVATDLAFELARVP